MTKKVITFEQFSDLLDERSCDGCVGDSSHGNCSEGNCEKWNWLPDAPNESAIRREVAGKLLDGIRGFSAIYSANPSVDDVHDYTTRLLADVLGFA